MVTADQVLKAKWCHDRDCICHSVFQIGRHKHVGIDVITQDFVEGVRLGRKPVK